MSQTYVGSAIAPLGYALQAKGPSLGGVLLSDLTAQFGSPLYVMDGKTLRHQAQAYHKGLKPACANNYLVAYACKANLNVGLATLMAQEGLGFDVVSAGELYTVLKAGVLGDQILFNGNNKSAADLQMALEAGVHRISVDNLSEIPLIAGVARGIGKKALILLRVTPGIECHTHDYIKTGQHDSKFGLGLEHLEATVADILNNYADCLELKGLHAHIGSQIFELRAYEDLVRILLEQYALLKARFGLVLTDIDLGGGLGINYTEADDPPDISALLERLTTGLQQQCQRHNYPQPRVILEPGRSMVARAGVTLYSVGSRKDVPGYPSFIAVDGGMGDNIRPALYQASYTAVVANKLGQPAEETVKLVGKYCESGDVVLPSFSAPRLEPGDTVMVFATGAYNYAMSSHYNRFAPPAMVLVEDGRADWLVARESLEDLLAQDRLPAWLLPTK